ncbi:MAG: hypothetical protein IJX71_01930 [Oscillospiraceae bacterium]|nr:hypothetical protein [Oscillospiraceae bacterium]
MNTNDRGEGTLGFNLIEESAKALGLSTEDEQLEDELDLALYSIYKSEEQDRDDEEEFWALVRLTERVDGLLTGKKVRAEMFGKSVEGIWKGSDWSLLFTIEQKGGCVCFGRYADCPWVQLVEVPELTGGKEENT